MADTPDNPFENESNGHEAPPLIENGAAEEGLSKGTPEVAAKAGKTFLVLGIVGAVVLLLLYSIVSGDKPPPTPETATVIKVTPAGDAPPPLPPVEPTTPLTPPPITDLPPIPEPITPPAMNPLNPPNDAAAQAQAQARLRSSMMVRDGGSETSPATTPTAANRTPNLSMDPNSAFAASLANTKSEQVEATRISDLHRTIAQGRIIQATMESALNTDLPAPIRAIVSRDTYGEAGNIPLIPKGSRLIGQYNTTLTSGQTRVFVVWTRVIRPDGVDVMLGSPMVDAIGQAGVAGQLDTKFQEIFARSFVSSVMNIAMAIGSEKITGGGEQTTTTSTTGSQTTGDAATTATTNALNRLGSTTDSFIQRFLSVPPTILVDQGTPVNVFVNKDLVFPGDTAGTRMVY